jgi:SOS-response transcriptional repressor LexA
MTELKQRLKELRKVHLNSLSQKKLSEEIGYKLQTIRHLEAGTQKTIPAELIQKLNERYKINPNWLLYGQGDVFCYSRDESTQKYITLPYFPSGVPCGNSKIIHSEAIEKIKLPVEYARDIDFVVRANGISMIHEGIIDGSKLLIKRQTYLANNGDIMILNIIDNGCTCKKVYLDQQRGKYILQAANPEFEPEEYEVNEVSLVGIVKRIITDK